MSDNDPRSMAKRLRAELAERDVDLTHGQALELVAHQHGHKDWNTMSAAAQPAGATGAHARSAIPVFRMFDTERTFELYVDFLGSRSPVSTGSRTTSRCTSRSSVTGSGSTCPSTTATRRPQLGHHPRR